MTLIGTRPTGSVLKVTMTTGGSGYSAPPAVTISGGATAASAFAVMAGTVVDSVILVNSGAGYTTPTVTFGGSGGAAATATVQSGVRKYMTFFKGRQGDMYGVDGMGRGIRWDGGSTIEPIGINKPVSGPTVTASAGGSSYVAAVQMVNGGAGYNNVPSVVFTGGSPTKTATAKAVISNGRVSSVIVTDGGKGYQATPALSLSGGIGSSAAFTVGVIGGVADVRVTASGSGYTSAATVAWGSTNGLTSQNAKVVVGSGGKVDDIIVTSRGTGGTSSGVAATVTGGGGSGAALAVQQFFRVNAVEIANSGSGYMTPPVITFVPATGDQNGGGAAATCTVNQTGNIASVHVYRGGTYSSPPTAVILDTTAKAMATMQRPLQGKYKCCFRYLDDTPKDVGGPIASSISELIDVDVPAGSGSLTWTLPNSGLDDRVAAAELWRTTTDQSVILFRVATIQRADFGTPYTGDTLSDAELSSPNRQDYALMPVTLPSGQVNARRFEVPPSEFAVACMFQDRAWYGVDVTGKRPNALMYSEIDEPESVPQDNELIIQENTTTPDRLVGMIPLGSTLLLLQTGHLYKLAYVAQPVIDASIVLGAYRGILNQRCADVMGGVAYIVDSEGMYAYDGQQEEPVSVAVDNYWRTEFMDFTKSDLFHVRADPGTRVVRLYYCRSSDTAPVRALCYCVATKAWWEEEYPTAVTATCRSPISGKLLSITGTADGTILRPLGSTDSGNPIAYEYRTGDRPLGGEDDRRTITFLYTPTSSDSNLSLSLAYNGTASPRANAISTDRGSGFATIAGSTSATLNMKLSRSALGNASGVARAFYSGRVEPLSAGGDRHVAMIASGTASEPVTIHTVSIEGAE